MTTPEKSSPQPVPDMARVGDRLWRELRYARTNGLQRAVVPYWDYPSWSKPKKAPARAVVRCGRCDGLGAIASFSARYSGKCFACNGSGTRLGRR